LSRRQLVIGDLGHVKDLDVISNSKVSNRTFGTANYLAPEAYELRRSNKIDIWSFGCIVYELFHLDKLFNNRNPDKLRDSIRTFQVENFKSSKIRPLYVRVIKRYLFLLLFLKNCKVSIEFWIFHLHFKNFKLFLNVFLRN
jgi:serine/threonine protein kinase